MNPSGKNNNVKITNTRLFSSVPTDRENQGNLKYNFHFSCSGKIREFVKKKVGQIRDKFGNMILCEINQGILLWLMID